MKKIHDNLYSFVHKTYLNHLLSTKVADPTADDIAMLTTFEEDDALPRQSRLVIA